MEEIVESQKELAKAVFDMAGHTSGPNKQVVTSIGYQIQSNERLEKAISDFSSATSRTEKVMIGLAIAQVFLAVATLFASNS